MGPAHPCVRVVLHLCDHRVPLIVYQHRSLRLCSILSHPRLRNHRPYPPLRKIRRRQGQGRGGTREVKQNHYDKIFPWAKDNTCGPFSFSPTGQCASRLGITALRALAQKISSPIISVGQCASRFTQMLKQYFK